MSACANPVHEVANAENRPMNLFVSIYGEPRGVLEEAGHGGAVHGGCGEPPLREQHAQANSGSEGGASGSDGCARSRQFD